MAQEHENERVDFSGQEAGCYPYGFYFKDRIEKDPPSSCAGRDIIRRVAIPVQGLAMAPKGYGQVLFK